VSNRQMATVFCFMGVLLGIASFYGALAYGDIPRAGWLASMAILNVLLALYWREQA